ncbi:F-box domain containing protein [Mycena sanguinolenta]|uniref:F-box domain containing protein n=1 Tax=Mycena sanguinolenta TaxID=230812 RepID=A0A8H6ZH17_9AGAR|nr:F-box domain containing protein [Mycena sanguinolenta]
MAEIALINIDKCEVVNPADTGYGFKMKEAIANRMAFAFLWLFTVPADNQPAPPPSTAPPKGFLFGRRGPAAPRVPVGHWAGDRVIIVDEYSGDANTALPADMLAKFSKADPEDDVLHFAFDHLKHIDLPGYEHAGADDALFPVDRVWVVRNLTKGWYARSNVLIKAKDRREPDSNRLELGLGDLIWADIGGSVCGAWVGKGGRGDRFDVQTIAAVENSNDGIEWKDLSKEAKSCLLSFNMHDDVKELRW